MESLRNQFQHIYVGTFEEDNIIKHLEEITSEVITRALHCDMVGMSSS